MLLEHFRCRCLFSYASTTWLMLNVVIAEDADKSQAPALPWPLLGPTELLDRPTGGFRSKAMAASTTFAITTSIEQFRNSAAGNYATRRKPTGAIGHCKRAIMDRPTDQTLALAGALT